MRSLIAAGLCTLAISGLAACGGGGGTGKPAEQTVRGTGFVFRAPDGWSVVRRGSVVSASPKPTSPEIVSVSVFRTTKPYRPSLFAKAIPELDRVTNDYARRLGGSVETSSTVTVVGARARQYTVRYTKGAQELKERITLVFHDRTEYQLLCQWKGADAEPPVCARLTATFRRI
jgi:hypothetical protein